MAAPPGGQMPPDPNWKQTFSTEKRAMFLTSLTTGLQAVAHQKSEQEVRAISQKFEFEVFDKSTSESEYMRRIAEKIVILKQKKAELQRAQDAALSGVPSIVATAIPVTEAPTAGVPMARPTTGISPKDIFRQGPPTGSTPGPGAFGGTMSSHSMAAHAPLPAATHVPTHTSSHASTHATMGSHASMGGHSGMGGATPYAPMGGPPTLGAFPTQGHGGAMQPPPGTINPGAMGAAGGVTMASMSAPRSAVPTAGVAGHAPMHAAAHPVPHPAAHQPTHQTAHATGHPSGLPAGHPGAMAATHAGAHSAAHAAALASQQHGPPAAGVAEPTDAEYWTPLASLRTQYETSCRRVLEHLKKWIQEKQPLVQNTQAGDAGRKRVEEVVNKAKELMAVINFLGETKERKSQLPHDRSARFIQRIELRIKALLAPYAQHLFPPKPGQPGAAPGAGGMPTQTGAAPMAEGKPAMPGHLPGVAATPAVHHTPHPATHAQQVHAGGINPAAMHTHPSLAGRPGFVAPSALTTQPGHPGTAGHATAHPTSAHAAHPVHATPHAAATHPSPHGVLPSPHGGHPSTLGAHPGALAPSPHGAPHGGHPSPHTAHPSPHAAMQAAHSTAHAVASHPPTHAALPPAHATPHPATHVGAHAAAHPVGHGATHPGVHPGVAHPGAHPGAAHPGAAHPGAHPVGHTPGHPAVHQVHPSAPLPAAHPAAHITPHPTAHPAGPIPKGAPMPGHPGVPAAVAPHPVPAAGIGNMPAVGKGPPQMGVGRGVVGRGVPPVGAAGVTRGPLPGQPTNRPKGAPMAVPKQPVPPMAAEPKVPMRPLPATPEVPKVPVVKKPVPEQLSDWLAVSENDTRAFAARSRASAEVQRAMDAFRGGQVSMQPVDDAADPSGDASPFKDLLKLTGAGPLAPHENARKRPREDDDDGVLVSHKRARANGPDELAGASSVATDLHSALPASLRAAAAKGSSAAEVLMRETETLERRHSVKITTPPRAGVCMTTTLCVELANSDIHIPPLAIHVPHAYPTASAEYSVNADLFHKVPHLTRVLAAMEQRVLKLRVPCSVGALVGAWTEAIVSVLTVRTSS